MTNLKETDLYIPVRDFLKDNGYEVRSEVKDCDVAAVKGEELLIVELKKSLSVELLVQAVKRQKLTDIVYMAVPKPKRMVVTKKWKDIIHLVRRLELGLILISFRGEKGICEVAVEPECFDRIRSTRGNIKNRDKLIKEFNGRQKDLNTGGSRGTKLITAYRESSVFIACCLSEYNELSPKKLREIGTDKEKTTSILYTNHYGWFAPVKKGIYRITEAGKLALPQYKDLTEYFYEKINEYKKNT